MKALRIVTSLQFRVVHVASDVARGRIRSKWVAKTTEQQSSAAVHRVVLLHIANSFWVHYHLKHHQLSRSMGLMEEIVQHQSEHLVLSLRIT